MHNEEATQAQPDWAYWNACDLVLISEAVALSLGLDPKTLDESRSKAVRGSPQLDNEYRKRLELAERAMWISDRPYETGMLATPDGTHRTGVEPASFREFLRARGLDVNPSWQPGKASNASWPWGKYETPLLRHLNAAAQKFWVNYDPSDASTAPTNDEVTGWLETARKCSRTQATAIATILRADGIRPGPRRAKV